MQNSDALVTAIVAVGMGAAAVIDLRTRRIPNLLTASLAAVGVGIAAADLGRVGLGAALLGCLLGLAFMLPGHIFGATGAGDVKLPHRHYLCLSLPGDCRRRPGAARRRRPPPPDADHRHGRPPDRR